MAVQNPLIMKLLRIITPEEIGDIATKHNGGKFLSLNDLVNERVEHKIYRDFTSSSAMDEIHDDHSHTVHAKILPFKKSKTSEQEAILEFGQKENALSTMLDTLVQITEAEPEVEVEEQEKIEHKDNENMSSFILIEKARLKRSQQILKQKEIIDLYQKNSHVDVEQIKSSNSNFSQERESGVLVNKKQF